MLAYRLADARSLYAIIDGVEALIEGDWIAAGPRLHWNESQLFVSVDQQWLWNNLGGGAVREFQA